ncbi:MAG: PaaI family thioesterase [Candidatus Cloacimonadales bacterium]|jgi:uncharacterized protein (TIGR00369 family)|nr:PaaI family thioesterase [Candidatus Cloacimonadota bacterium]MDY0381294.1 PaaI family thioesterase [Candidatus Cloacimonadaceae bacterium]HCX59196.1 PaaI family thioesterase [Candidatus Cloacimonas sp.]MCB5257119.1 PaaI family thioesterase [Candidatus Cloacimonadota bacterium]MCB5276611.1 PaaI family thioesterase [Candidatus Cloacimonadota bacterium]
MKKEYQNCFVCGKDNPIGMKVDFSYDDEGSANAELKLSELFEGYPKVIHGGILSALLDEVMAKAVIHQGKIAFTAKLNVIFRKPLASDSLVMLRGTVVSAKTRTILTEARIYDATAVYAEAEAVFIVPKEQ